MIRDAAVGAIGRSPALLRGLLRSGVARARSMVLLYHTIAPSDCREHVIDRVSPERLLDQLRALSRIGDIVPLGALLSRREPGTRPAFAITFDDDDVTHVRYALPVLRELGVPATFFLSGRSLHGRGAYWWSLLEQSVEEVGVEETCRRIGHAGRTIKEIARSCRRAATVVELSTRVAPPVMTAADIRELAANGMTIGFHTIAHSRLTRLGASDLQASLTDGRDALASVAAAPIDWVAYPYGQADARVAEAARRARYLGAFTTIGRPFSPCRDHFLVGRWQPGSATPERLVAEAILRLMMPVTQGGGRERSGRTSDAWRDGPASAASTAV